MLRKLLSWAGLACLAGLIASSADAQQISGAIFTTDSTGTVVNGNTQYTDPSQVYLNGGPNNQNCSAAGLPNGLYYFQVTDPSGATLLSTDAAANRLVTVSNGVISSYSGTHVTYPAPCGSITVQLSPYNQTTNSGGEYKAWLIAASELSGTKTLGCGTTHVDPSDATKLVFADACAKTDNFKLQIPTCTATDGSCPSISYILSGKKFYDQGLMGWKMR